MKKTFAFTIVIIIVFALAACGGDLTANNNIQNQSGNDQQNGDNAPENKRETTLIFEAAPISTTEPTPPEFTCTECGAYCAAWDEEALCGLCALPKGASSNIWNLTSDELWLAIRELVCRGTDTYHGGGALLALSSFDELLELYHLFLSQDEEAIVERMKTIACVANENDQGWVKNCACPYRTQAALNSIFNDFVDMTEIRFPIINGPQPTRVLVLHEGHNNKINISYGKINGMNFTVAVHPMYSTNEGWIKEHLESLSPIKTIGDVEIYLTQEPSEPDEEFGWRGVTHAYFDLNINGQYVSIYVSNPPCEPPPQGVSNWWDYRCDYCNNMSQGARCYGSPVDLQTALDVIVQFDFRTLL